jgi:hypothetical protein
MNNVNISNVSTSHNPITEGVSNDSQHYWGSDMRLYTKVGERQGKNMCTTGQTGLLVYGPYAPFNAGTYQVTAIGTAKSSTEGCWLDVVCDLGQRCMIKIDIPPASSTGDWTASTEFVLESAVENIETRLWVPATADISLLSIAITPSEKLTPIIHNQVKVTETSIAHTPTLQKQYKKNKRR